MQFRLRQPTTRLALKLLAVAVALLVLRLAVLLFVNGDRLSTDEVENLRFQGRYYPIQKICLVIDDNELEKSLAGDPPLAKEGLLATGNGFSVNRVEKVAWMKCGWRNWNFDTNARVEFLFLANVFATAVDKSIFKCLPADPARTAHKVTLGRYSGCRETGRYTVKTLVVDDNATVSCSVEAADDNLIAAMRREMESECQHLLDRLARSRPIPFWGNDFWTVR